MSTPISDFYEVLRVLLGDTEDIQRRSDAQLLRSVKAALKLNKLPDFAVVVDDIEPAITDPNDFALLAYETAVMLLAPEARGYSMRRRAMARSFSDQYRFLSDLQTEIHSLQNGALFTGWQDYQSFFEGAVGLPLAAKFIDVKNAAPWNTVSLGGTGGSGD